MPSPTPEQAEQAERMYAALNRGDLDAFLAEVDPDVVFRSLVAEMEDEEFRGHEGVRRWFTQVAEALGGLRFAVEAFDVVDAAGDAAMTRVRVEGSVAGVEVLQRMWQTVRFREGKAVWWQTFRTEREARDALDQGG